jgi:hypothetical protein
MQLKRGRGSAYHMHILTHLLQIFNQKLSTKIL